MKYRMHTLILMLLICWASQSSAQPTRTVVKSTKLPKFDYLIKDCEASQGVTTEQFTFIKNREESLAQSKGNSQFKFNWLSYALTYVSPLKSIANTGGDINRMAEEKNPVIGKTVRILQLPQHGTLVSGNTFYSLQTPVGDYSYMPNLDYQGDDRVIFSAQFKGKTYKVIVNLKVRKEIDNHAGGDNQDNLCPDSKYPKLIKSKSMALDSIDFDTLQISTQQIQLT